MKKIVNGRLFDTSEAISVVSWTETAFVFGIGLEVRFKLMREKVSAKPSEGLKLLSWGGVSDYDVVKDESRGDFFLVTQIGLDYGKIRPVDVDEAKRIFEEHTSCDYSVEDDYQKYFGVRPRKSDLEMLKEAFKAGAEAKQKQYEEAEAARRKKAAEAGASD